MLFLRNSFRIQPHNLKVKKMLKKHANITKTSYKPQWWYKGQSTRSTRLSHDSFKAPQQNLTEMGERNTTNRPAQISMELQYIQNMQRTLKPNSKAKSPETWGAPVTDSRDTNTHICTWLFTGAALETGWKRSHRQMGKKSSAPTTNPA